MKHAALLRASKVLEGKDILVSFSGGKDSWIVLDLAKQFARRVEAFAMELVPGLRCFDAPIELAEARYGMRIRRYPHWLRAKFAREGCYCFDSANWTVLELNDLYAVARHDAKIDLIAMGAKRADSIWRARTGAAKFAKGDVIAPIWDWSTRDVIAYLAVHKIPKPPKDGWKNGGVDLTTEGVLWMHDNYFDDYCRLETQYPFVGAIVKRRELYGIGEQSKAADAKSSIASTLGG